MVESIATFHLFLTQVAPHLTATMATVQAATMATVQAVTMVLVTIHMVSTNHTMTSATSHHGVHKRQDPAGN